MENSSTDSGSASTGLVEGDTPCRKCAYNLRSLPVSGNCPECGAPVGAAIFGGLLKFSLPEWIGGLTRGAKLAYAGLAVALGGIVSTFFFAVLAANYARSLIYLMWLVPLVGIVVGCSMTIVGWWMLTKADPSGLGEDRYGSARRLIRITLLIWVVGVVLQTISNFSPGSSYHLSIVAMSAVALIALAFSLEAQLRYVDRLAFRIPDIFLVERARSLQTTFPIAYAVLVGFPVLMVSWPGARSGFGCFGVCLEPIAAIVVLACFLSYSRLLSNLARRLSEVATASKLVWKEKN